MTNSTNKIVRIAMVIPYFGVFPEYMNYFLQTCIKNKNIDFLVFTDADTAGIHVMEDNIIVKKISLSNFNSIATEKIGLNIKVESAYKLCDFKPMYGEIFEDYLRKYDFWGFCDIDILLGNTSAVLNDCLLDSFDVISAHSQYLSGPFSLFRNRKDINALYKQSKDWVKVVTTDRVFLFDEASNVMPHLWQGLNIFDFSSEVESMTHVLMNKHKNVFTVFFGSFITERVKKSLTWCDGHLHDNEGNEVFVFHYIVYKSKWNFSVPVWCNENVFRFDNKGFCIENNKYSIDRFYDFAGNYLLKIKNIRKKIMQKLNVS